MMVMVQVQDMLEFLSGVEPVEVKLGLILMEN